MTAILKTVDLSMHFGGVAAVDKLNMEVAKGEIRGLIGPNGAGKTTSFNLISGVLKPTSGQVFYAGEPICGRDPADIAALGVVRTFQRTALFGHFSVLRNVMIARHLHARESLLQAIFGTGSRVEAETEREAREILSFIGLAKWVDQDAHNLPYGYQRALNVAMAMATEPKVLMLDEPVAGMNPVETAEMAKLIRRLRDERGITIVLVEHDMSTVMNLCEQITVLDFGKKIAEGTPRQIARNPQVIEAYLGSEESVA